MNTRAKGSRLEAKSIAWLRSDGATLVFRGKGLRRSANEEGVAQVDLIAFYDSGWVRLVEVTVPGHRARARNRLRKLWRRMAYTIGHEVHVWKPRAKEPEREEVGA